MIILTLVPCKVPLLQLGLIKLEEFGDWLCLFALLANGKSELFV